MRQVLLKIEKRRRKAAIPDLKRKTLERAERCDSYIPIRLDREFIFSDRYFRENSTRRLLGAYEARKLPATAKVSLAQP